MCFFIVFIYLLFFVFHQQVYVYCFFIIAEATLGGKIKSPYRAV